MQITDYQEIPVLAGYMIGAGIATFDQVATTMGVHPLIVEELAFAARIRRGDFNSFRRWLKRSSTRTEAWAAYNQILRRIQFGNIG
jgi:hypothetical protein